MQWLTDWKAWGRAFRQFAVIIMFCYVCGFFVALGMRAAGGIAMIDIYIEQDRASR